MGERSITGFAIDISHIEELPGSGTADRNVVDRALAHEQLVRELDDFFGYYGSGSTEEVLCAVLAGDVQIDKYIEYRRLLELLGLTLGRQLEPSMMIIPGYGLDEAGPLLSHLGLRVLGTAWAEHRLHFPCTLPKEHLDSNWPKAVVIRQPELPLVQAELRSYDRTILVNSPLSGDPKVDELLTTPGEALVDPDDRHLEFLLEGISMWVETTLTTEQDDLMLIVDGDR